MRISSRRQHAAALIAFSCAACAALIVAQAAPATAGTPTPTASPNGWHALAPGAAPASNPLEGFIPYAGSYSTFPYSMEWFYIPLSAVMNGPDSFNWSALESQLAAIATRGHQAAVRFYLDYPGKPSGIPQYLLNEGLVTHSYNDYGNNSVSVSPNYDDPNLDTALDQFIAAFGAHYDGDARIGYVELGLLGFWGEWHTYPYNGQANPQNWFASPAEQQRVMTDYVNAFTRTKLLVRYPSADNAALPIGYHDDSFALETLPGPGWHFMDLMTQADATDKWRTEPIAGELRPELQYCIFDATPDCPVIESGGDNDFTDSVAQTHASWLLNQYAFAPGYTGTAYTDALAGSMSLGYRLQVTSALTPHVAADGRLSVGAAIEDTGIAPFYYDWPLQIAAVDQSGRIARTWTTDWKLTDVAAGAGASRFTADLSTKGLCQGRYTLVLRAANPLSGGVPLRFADRDQDVSVSGWLTLGSTVIVP